MKIAPTFEFENAIPSDIGKLANVLHSRRVDDLTIECAEPASLTSINAQGLWSIAGNQLTFSSREARNQCVAMQSYRALINDSSAIEPKKLFELTHKLRRDESGDDDCASGRLLALASSKINIFQAAASLINAGEVQVFNALHSIKSALPYVADISVDDLITITIAQHPKTKNDGAAGMLFTDISTVLLPNPSLAWELYRRVKEEMTEATASLYNTALLVLLDTEHRNEAVERALEDTESNNSLVASVSTWVTASAIASTIQDEKLRNRCIERLRAVVHHSVTEVRNNAIRGLAKAATTNDEFLGDLLKLSYTKDQYVLGTIADHLFMHVDAVKEKPLFADLVRSLVHLSPNAGRGDFTNVDWVFYRLLKDERYVGLVRETMTQWLCNKGSSKVRDRDLIAQFDQTIGGFAKNPDLLSQTITEWLLSKEVVLAAACRDLISYLLVRRFKEPIFSKCILDTLDAQDLMLLTRRMLGYIVSEDALLSLTFSLLATENAQQRTFGIVHAVLAQEIGRDYTEQTLEAIKEKLVTASPELKSMLTDVSDHLTAYIKCIDDLPRILELRPPMQLRRAISLRKHKEMRKTMDAADEKSVMRQLVTNVSIKAGVGCFSVADGKVGQTMRMSKFSHEVVLPRRAFTDPIGYEIRGLGFRIAKRDEA